MNAVESRNLLQFDLTLNYYRIFECHKSVTLVNPNLTFEYFSDSASEDTVISTESTAQCVARVTPFGCDQSWAECN